MDQKKYAVILMGATMIAVGVIMFLAVWVDMNHIANSIPDAMKAISRGILGGGSLIYAGLGLARIVHPELYTK